jgi:hypothetical protein
MGVTRLTAVMVGLGLLGSPLEAVYCREGSPAAKACCQQRASTCNEPGTTDDCCHPTPPDKGRSLLPAAKAELKAKSTSLLVALHTLTPVILPADGLTGSTNPVTSSSPPQASPPRSSVLRI